MDQQVDTTGEEGVSVANGNVPEDNIIESEKQKVPEQPSQEVPTNEDDIPKQEMTEPNAQNAE